MAPRTVAEEDGSFHIWLPIVAGVERLASWACVRTRWTTPCGSAVQPSRRVKVEVLFDNPGHVRLPDEGDEIVDRALAVRILESGEMWPSIKANNPKDARFGDGQYMSDIQTRTKTPGQLSHAFVRVPWAGHKFSHFFEIDVRGMEIMRSVERPDVYVYLNNGPLDLTGRIISHGKS